jgi:hypothetical protein
MKVFVVFEMNIYDAEKVIGIYLDEEKAKKAVDRYNKGNSREPYYHVSFIVIE